MGRKFIITLWSLLGIGIVTTCFLTVAIWNGWIGFMPPVEELQNPIDKYATQIYSSDGKILGTWSKTKNNRIIIPYDSISPNVINALVATEDARFFDHSGIDFYALGRAIVKRGILGQSNAGGGSTITQQLAKQLFTAHARSTFERVLQKPIEWIIALKLERHYTKEEILAMYLNYFDFLHNAVGIKMASNTYFSKDPCDLSVTEAATLVGLCKNPSYFNPVRYPERSEERRNIVLHQMLKAEYITDAEYGQYRSEPLTLNFHEPDHKDGTAVYFREFLRKYMTAQKPDRSAYPSWGYAQFFLDSIAWVQDPLYGWCNKNLKKDGTPYDVYSDGLKIRTSINSRMQKYAEESVYRHVAKYLQPHFVSEGKTKENFPFTSDLTPEQVSGILYRTMKQSDRWRNSQKEGYSDEEILASFHKPVSMTIFTYHGDIDTTMTPLDSIRYIKSFLRAGFMSMDPKTGEVKAYVGGLDYYHFKYDMVMQGRRQVGSTIKPYLYALAMENGMTPCDQVPNYAAYPGWRVQGAGGGTYTLRAALQRSLNGVSTQLMKKFSPHGKEFVAWLNKFGVYTPDVRPNKTMCLGSCDVSVGEMVSGYTAFANNGFHTAPMFVTSIEDADGHVLATFKTRMNEVISAEGTYKMLDVMRAVVNGGTASRVRWMYHLMGDIVAKTGTTNRNSDAWFMGVTPDLVSGCWVGGEDRDIHFDNMNYGQGASMALPIWAYYMTKVYQDKSLGYNPEVKFDVPRNFNTCAKPEEEDVGEEDEVQW